MDTHRSEDTEIMIRQTEDRIGSMIAWSTVAQKINAASTALFFAHYFQAPATQAMIGSTPLIFYQ